MMITVQREQSQLTRNITWFKRATPGQDAPGEDPDIQDDNLLDSTYPGSPREDAKQQRRNSSGSEPSTASVESGVNVRVQERPQ